MQSAVSIFQDAGVVVLHNALQDEFVDTCARAATANLERCQQALSTRGIDMGSEAFAFREIAHRSRGRFDMQLREGVAPCAVSDASIASNAPWGPLVRALLGDSAFHQFTGAVVSQPGSEAQRPHMDGGHLFGVEGTEAVECPVHWCARHSRTT